MNMAKILNKDPVTYERERQNFIKELQHFHETRGTSFKKCPKISGNDIDLYLLYVLVTAHGGWIKVNTRNEWASLCEQFHLPDGCVNSGVGLKQIYLRYLDRYEKVHFLGEDGQQADDDDEDSRHRKWSARSLHSVPLTYNHHQHNVAESLREYNGLSADLYKPSNYDKLSLSLLSPLPNEQDFAINVCTLLSNEGKHTLRLDKYPRLINILLAHAGVFDSPGTRQLFIEVYSRVRNYSINSFWSDVVDSPSVLDLTDERSFMKKPSSCPNTFLRRKTLEKERGKKLKESKSVTEDAEPMEVDSPECERLEIPPFFDENLTDQNQNSIKFEDEDKDLFCMGRTLGTQDPYGQRVLQIASILRNLSFTSENAAVLGRNRCFLRFVLLSVCARWSNLHQLGFDILGNIANEIILKEAGERLSEGILSCVIKGIESADRFIAISCLEVLNKLSQQDSNEEIVTFGLDDNVYELICRFLALSDIALLVYTLECLYALTSLGERPCTSVAKVRGAIDTLVALVTVEAQSYGPKACILMRVVETVSTVPASTTNSGQTSVSSTVTTASTTNAVVTTPVASLTSTTTTATTTATTTMTISAPVSPVTSRPTTPAAPVSKAASNKLAEAANSLQQQHAHQQIIQENEQFALGWLRATFELAPGVKIEQEELYKKYLGCCTKIGRRGVIAPLHFPRCVRSVFGGTIGPNPAKGETTGTQYYEGIRVRATPAPVTYPSQNAVAINAVSSAAITTPPVKVLPVQQRTVTPINPAPDSTALDKSSKFSATPASPILKAQLSAPPKPSPNQPHNPATITKVDSKSQVSVAHPHLSQALLASGSQPQQQQQQQQQPTQLQVQQQQQPPTQMQSHVIQVVTKDDNRSGTTSSSIIKSLLATKVTVSGDCMPSAAVTCVSPSNACVTNTTVSIASSISANQLITSNQVAQRQQQQKLLQQQLSGGNQVNTVNVMPVSTIISTPTTTSAQTTLPLKSPANSKLKNITTLNAPAKKVQRVNGAKIVVANNCDKTDTPDSDNQLTTMMTPTMSAMTENHINAASKVCKPPLGTASVSSVKQSNIRPVCTSFGEDSDSTNNSLASSSGIGGSRDCPNVGIEEENSLISFEGILQNGASGSLDIDPQEDGSSKDSSSLSSKDNKPLGSLMLADLLERKIEKDPLVNGVIGKNSSRDKCSNLVENHINKALKDLPDSSVKTELEPGLSDETLIEAPRGIKRSPSESEEPTKKPKYSNGTTSPEVSVDGATVESTMSSLKSEPEDSEDKDNEKVTVSSTAANLYAALAADCIEDETDLDEPIKEEPVVIKEEPRAFINQIDSQIQQQVSAPTQQLIVTAPRQIVVQQAIQANNQVIIPTTQMKARATSQPQVLLQQSAGGQLQYVVSGGVPGQNYVLAQSQTALVQGQAQTVLVAQTTQQQGTGAKTIIILQPQSSSQTSPKVVAMTPQGQQVVVTQVPRPIIQSSALGNIPPPLVPTSAAIPQGIIVNSSIAQSNTNTVTVTIPAMAQACPVTSSVPSRVVTPTPASTPPPTRPTTPHQVAATHAVSAKQPVKVVKATNSNVTTSTDNDSKASVSQLTGDKTITIKIDPNAYLCEWRGCLRQFKSAHEVYLHVCEAHCPSGSDEILCLWASCDGLKRRRFSLMTHLYDKHCNSESMAARRKQLTATGKTEVSTSTPQTSHHPGYAPNAAFHAIKRHALEFVNPKELMDDNEGPVTKSIRLTAALILRNLVIYSAHGRRHLRAYEPHLAGVALSNVESSRTIAQVLYDMNDQSNNNRR
ncbi:AT-rich interactive domain-containing protein 2 isoform X2 [Chelonus insularis]|uniref:AT-rich interactive domain-containing protein 2 isoform X2 n=1 Tax=Chelonus insularis TaxID=460826 RepID=UPI001589CA7C|nr:AT-rich interactive domain-containing protein 2 isoform X2 [Chelonus insularis]